MSKKSPSLQFECHFKNASSRHTAYVENMIRLLRIAVSIVEFLYKNLIYKNLNVKRKNNYCQWW